MNTTNPVRKRFLTGTFHSFWWRMGLVTQFDNLDDRRESRRLFETLDPADRYRFVRWAASIVSDRDNCRPSLSMDEHSRSWVRAARRGDRKADARVTNEAWAMLWLLTASWDLEIDHVLEILSLCARGKLRLTDLPSGSYPDNKCGGADGSR